MPGQREANLEKRVERDAEKLRKLRLAEEAARGAANARAAGREKGLGRGPGEGDPIPPGPAERATSRTSPVKAETVTSPGGFVHVDISADDPARAARFFQTVFGWQVQELPGPTPYRLLLPTSAPGSPGIGAGIGKRELPWQSVTPTIEVPSAGEYARRIVEAGGVIVSPASAMPGVGTLVVFKDTEGNIFGILEPAATPFAPPPPATPRRRPRR
ncbi:MAG: hypothetical protein KIS68_08700 [Bauldia sp.]|nr:hypothetical protein [Bauldia sp.]